MKQLPWFLTLVIAAAGCGDGKQAQDQSKHQTAGTGASTAPESADLKKIEPSGKYPLKTCVVSGEALGQMGAPVTYSYKGTEVQFCCPECIDKFNADPEKYMAKVRAASK